MSKTLASPAPTDGHAEVANTIRRFQRAASAAITAKVLSPLFSIALSRMIR